MNELIQQGIITEKTGGQNVQYVLNDKKTFSLTEYKVLKNQGKTFIKSSKVLYNGKIKLIYYTSTYKSLRNMLTSLDGDAFLSIIVDMLRSVIEIKNNGFLSCMNLDLSFDKVFVDQNTLEVSLIYLPINNPDTDIASFENELRTEIVKLISCVPAFSNDKMARVSGYLSNGTLSFNQLYSSICSEMQGRSKQQGNAGSYGGKDPFDSTVSAKQPPMHFVSADNASNVDFIINKPEFVIGKNAAQVDGAITFNKTISRIHCKISYSNGIYYITDLGSTNGTFVNNSRIGAHNPKAVKSGDVIRLSNSIFKVEF